ncbi:hypothetical protein EDD85DRAFT_127664 [Armillaria nabsnona]|nr:hypothetical protein EDD85DRAFT_127664 [Armillaria nabsnona]
MCYHMLCSKWLCSTLHAANCTELSTKFVSRTIIEETCSKKGHGLPQGLSSSMRVQNRNQYGISLDSQRRTMCSLPSRESLEATVRTWHEHLLQ